MAYSTPTVGTWADDSDSRSSGGGLTIPAVGGTTDGRLLLLFVVGRPSDLATWTTPSGWTRLASSDEGGFEEVVLFGKIGAASESSVTLDTGTTQVICSGVMVSFPGGPASITGIVNAYAETARADYTSAHADVPTPAISTPSQNDCLIVYFSAGNQLRGAASSNPNSSTTLFSYHEYDGTFSDLTVWASYAIQTTAASVGASSFDLTSTDTLRSKGVVVALNGTPATTKYVKILADSPAASATGVEVVVYSAPSGSNYITGTTRYGSVNAQEFEASLESGSAVLKVLASDVGCDGLAVSTTVAAQARNTTYTTGTVSATIIEE